MTETLIILGLSFLAYILGSIPSSIWVGEALYEKDIREFGSGNAGATNTFRVLGTKAGILVLMMDVSKGLIAASLPWLLGFVDIYSARFVNLQLLFGLMAVVGHVFPVFANFKGGKGIATLLGMVIGIHYVPALICISLFLIVLFSTKYVSLSSILATISFPLLLIFIFKPDEPLFVAFGISAAIMVILTHQKNIKRLVAGNESKANIRIRKRMKGRDR
ncbi:MAG: glycerol-3-phosphate 1-O-acyltransferase PlsY [Bacteroidetes bacterium]|nr:glycerol-3-phosphate 1-O-acyltransferase PlsY [Bacteroidota bacterium]